MAESGRIKKHKEIQEHTLMFWNRLTAVLVVFILGISVAAGIIMYLNTDFSLYDNGVRLKVSKQSEEIRNVFLQNMALANTEKDIGDASETTPDLLTDLPSDTVSKDYPQDGYPYLVIDLSGNVDYADSQWKVNAKDQVLVQETLQQDSSFMREYQGYQKRVFTITSSTHACVGFIIYLVPESELTQNIYRTNLLHCFMPVILGMCLTILIVLIRTIYCNKRVLRPLQQVHTSSQAIIQGNYDVEVHRVYEENLKANEVGNLIYSFEMMRDELKEKQINEQNLKKAQQELISCISHDLRTPISTIRAYSEGIRDGVAKTSQEQTEYQEIIIRKTILLERMIKELLEYSNTQLNQMDIRKKELYLNEYLRDVLRELRIYVEQNDITFESQIMEDDVIVSIDTRRITEVLYNLVENSMKYIGTGNKVIRITAIRRDDHVEIHVLDHGIGISVEDIPYVFDKFYRAEKSRSSNVSGSGLGLSICKYIINQHGGEIYCRSRKSSGSDFWFTLPI